jgi:pseudaminic acid synthase
MSHFSHSFNIGGFPINDSSRPFIIAEMSGNHNQSLDRAIAIVDAAADAGAHAIKLQTYTADTMTVKGAHTIEEKGSLWEGRELYDLYKEAYTPWEWHEPIFAHAKKRGILAFSSPFDETAVDFLETLNVPAYKIASFENNHHPLLRKVARTGKPVIMSTGVSSPGDILASIKVFRDNGCKELVLLKCTSTYPSSPENTNLATIPHMRELYQVPIGLSDHTMGIGASVAAVALGARVIEKHFTLSRAEGGVDSAFSLEPAELKALVVESERAFLSMGTISYSLTSGEATNQFYKRSLYAATDLPAGTVITEAHLKVLRPAKGITPEFYDQVVGREVQQSIKAGTPLTWNLISK